MKSMLGLLAIVLLATDACADREPDLLTQLHSRSDVVVLGEFTSDPIGQSGEQGVIGYQVEFRIAELLKGEIREQRKPGGTIVVNTIRFEFEPEDRLLYFKQGAKAILFLKRNDRQSPVTYTVFDQWFGIQPALPAMAKTLASLPVKKTVSGSPKAEPSSAAGQKTTRLPPPNQEQIGAGSDIVAELLPVTDPKPVELSDEWRIFLPAGYELEIALKKIYDHRYTLQPAHYTFSGIYRIEGDRLVSEELDDSHNGQFAWKIVSPYLLTLVDQHAGIGSNYSGAIMFRPCPTAVLEKLRQHELEEKTSNQQKTGLKGVPQITVEQLSKEIRKEGFQWWFIGREIEFTSSQREGNRVHIDGMEKEILDTAVIHFGEGRVNRFDNLGERIRVRGLIVDQWYGVWQIWPYSMTNVKE